MKLQDRDKDILKEVFRFMCLTSYQIAELFDMNIKITQRRLRVLVFGDYLRKMLIPTTQSGRSPYLYYPGKAAEELFEIQGYKPRLTRQLSHQQKNTDLLIHLKKSADKAGIKCSLLPEHLIRISGQSLIPDGAFVLSRSGKSALFFIENCAGTEIIKSANFNEDIENKLIKYSEIFQNNEISFYCKFFEYNFQRFRLLYITNSGKRLESISQIVKKHDSFGFIYMATKSAFMKNGIFDPIWSIPAKDEISASIIKEK